MSGLFADPWLVTGDDLALWLSRDDLAPETRRSMRGAAVNFYAWAVRAGRIAESPAIELAPVILPRALPRPINQDALGRAVAMADDRVILLLASMAGLRRAEIAGLHFRDVVDGQIRVRGKGGHDRLVPLLGWPTSWRPSGCDG